MIRDPFYIQILKKLDELVGAESGDPFERCACDLLREIYPNLVPIVGGSDYGMDGSISDNGQIPLVCTVQESVTTNVRKNIESYVKDSGKERRVVVATPRKLTPRKRSNLERVIQEKGFHLIQSHDRESMANLLYSNSRWCKELLGLTGTPQSLSIFPIANRPFLDIPLVGRVNDIASLNSLTNDAILVGQPGTGKTSVLYQLVKENNAFFVINNDVSAIANEIRDKNPTTVIVDDAHTFESTLKTMMHLRREIAAEFNIIATSWPSYRKNIQETLHIPDQQVYELSLLTRDEIVDVIKACGIYGPNDLIREINHQSRGKPGLTVTLCHLIKIGGIEEVGLGDALARNIKHTFEPLTSKKATQVLAAFAMGGDTGFDIGMVSESLQLSIAEVQSSVVHLATGGVLEEEREKRLAVYPERLRQVLIRDVYYCGATALPSESLLNSSQNRASSVIGIICAKALGGDVNDDYIRQLIQTVPTAKVCEVYCSLGQYETEWVLNNYPQHLDKIVRTALHTSAGSVIPMLLDRAPADIDNLHAQPDADLRQLQDWCWAGYPGQDAVKRRKALLDAFLTWYDDNKEAIVAAKALQICFHPGYEGNESDPGMGITFTISRAHITEEDIKSCYEWWEIIYDYVKRIPLSHWKPIWELVDDWAYPGRHGMGNGTGEAFAKFSKQAASSMLRDIVQLYPSHDGVKHRLQSLSRHANLEISAKVGEEFDALYPIEDWDDYEKAEQLHQKNADMITNRWLQRAPEEIANKITTIEKQANDVGIHYPSYTLHVCIELAKKVNDPLAWFKVFGDAGLESRYLSPFLVMADITNNEYAQQVLSEWLEHPETKYHGLQILLDHPDLPEQLFADATTTMEEQHVNSVAFHRKSLPEEFVKALLTHSSDKIRCAIAIQEWRAHGKQPRKSLWPQWEAVITDPKSNNNQLKPIFVNHPELAANWLKNKIKANEYIYSTDYLVREVLKVINDDHRKALIIILDEDSGSNEELVKSLVNDDVEHYRLYLARPLHNYQYLYPLKGYPSNRSSWIGMVKLAIANGHSHDAIVFAGYGMSQSWSGAESEYQERWLKSFEKLTEHEDEDIRKIGEAGKYIANEKRQEAQKKEKKERIFGIK